MGAGKEEEEEWGKRASSSRVRSVSGDIRGQVPGPGAAVPPGWSPLGQHWAPPGFLGLVGAGAAGGTGARTQKL